MSIIFDDEYIIILAVQCLLLAWVVSLLREQLHREKEVSRLMNRELLHNTCEVRLCAIRVETLLREGAPLRVQLLRGV